MLSIYTSRLRVNAVFIIFTIRGNPPMICLHGMAKVILLHFLDLCQCLMYLANLQSSATSVTGFAQETWHNTDMQH
jgi:hypothetical protein